MKTTACHVTLFLAILSASGCASVAVTGSALEQRTASALGVPSTEITISNRTDSGVRTDYVATTSQNRVYNCYVTGTVSIVGRTVSDAMCSQTSGPAGAVGVTSQSDNALTRAHNQQQGQQAQPAEPPTTTAAAPTKKTTAAAPAKKTTEKKKVATKSATAAK